ncbi:Uncharacterised protein [Vibrio fluvialis]|uniref:Uncharacterized protein n=1 Tax=Vibrio fluvialis TaxID=676 RepID=A0AAX2LW87_VIBFL|nr:hypothetical protein KKIDH5335_50100 [Vibrio fluvialis]SUQ27508.1 Uncharacterised protein [Vibrio fluvialis]
MMIVLVIDSVIKTMTLSNAVDKPIPTNAAVKCPPIKGHVFPIGLLGITKMIVTEAPIDAINKGVAEVVCP